MVFYKDKKGYQRDNQASDLWHRKVAYHKIYLKNKEDYPLPFSEYEVHHINGDKHNNLVENLAILTPEEHIDIHLKAEELGLDEYEDYERKALFEEIFDDFTIQKNLKILRESGDREKLVDYLLYLNGIEHKPEHSRILAKNTDKEFFNAILEYYRRTGVDMNTEQLKEIISNKNEFLKITSPEEMRKMEAERAKKEMEMRYELKKQSIKRRNDNEKREEMVAKNPEKEEERKKWKKIGYFKKLWKKKNKE